jgi:hypothetical protein
LPTVEEFLYLATCNTIPQPSRQKLFPASLIICANKINLEGEEKPIWEEISTRHRFSIQNTMRMHS